MDSQVAARLVLVLDNEKHQHLLLRSFLGHSTGRELWLQNLTAQQTT